MVVQENQAFYDSLPVRRHADPDFWSQAGVRLAQGQAASIVMVSFLSNL